MTFDNKSSKVNDLCCALCILRILTLNWKTHNYNKLGEKTLKMLFER